jgi:hypothetical protein
VELLALELEAGDVIAFRAFPLKAPHRRLQFSRPTKAWCVVRARGARASARPALVAGGAS